MTDPPPPEGEPVEDGVEPPPEEEEPPKKAAPRRSRPAPADDLFSSSPPPSGGEEWLTTYADAITLLMAFFVMMFSISKVDPSRFEGVKKALTNEFGSAPAADPSSPDPSPDKPEAHMPAKAPPSSGEAAGALLELGHGDGRLAGLLSDVRKTDRGAALEFGDTAFFAPGSAMLRQAGRSALLTLVELELDRLVQAGHKVIIEGHTDATAPRGDGPLSSNWALSAARAGAVAKFLQDQGIPGDRIQAIGYAATRPVRKDGVSSPKDRRVVMRVEEDLAREP